MYAAVKRSGLRVVEDSETGEQLVLRRRPRRTLATKIKRELKTPSKPSPVPRSSPTLRAAVFLPITGGSDCPTRPVELKCRRVELRFLVLASRFTPISSPRFPAAVSFSTHGVRRRSINEVLARSDCGFHRNRSTGLPVRRRPTANSPMSSPRQRRVVKSTDPKPLTRELRDQRHLLHQDNTCTIPVLLAGR